MDNTLASVSSNWFHVGGCTFSNLFQQRAADPDFFQKPDLSELVDEEKSILLSKENSTEYCEVYVKLISQYKIQAVSFVCNAVKVEIFQGSLKEYLETIYGVVVDESDDKFKSYRYDVAVEKSGITDLTLRFLTDFNDVCIFGIMLHTAPNPSGITSLLPEFDCLNTKGVGDMSGNSAVQLDPIPDKLKFFLQIFKRSNQYNSLEQQRKQNVDINEKCTTTYKKTDKDIYSYIDNCFQEMELRLKRYLEDMEQRQNQKLDTILNILDNINK